MFIALLMLPLSSISLHQLGARPGCGPNAATPRAVVSSAMLTPAFVGSDFPSLKDANSNKKKTPRAEYPGFVLYRGFLSFSQYL